MLSDKQKDEVITEMERCERYQKVKGSVLGLNRYKMTEEDYVFLIQEHDRINTEKSKEIEWLKKMLVKERFYATYYHEQNSDLSNEEVQQKIRDRIEIELKDVLKA